MATKKTKSTKAERTKRATALYAAGRGVKAEPVPAEAVPAEAVPAEHIVNTTVEAAKPKVGRPLGKHSDKENYSQHSVWLSNAVYVKVKQAVITLPKGKSYELSKLVEHLLQEWLKGGANLPE